jgi:ankyrin repeat protein
VGIVELLAAQPGMDVNAPCLSGKTPLMLVVDYCPAALPALLKVTDLNVNAQDYEQRTALHLACLRRNPLDERLPAYIKLLLNVPDLDKNIMDAHGYTPMMYALKRKDAVLTEELQRVGVEIIESPATMRL